MSITLKEIAELAGVHKSTVDKVIHNRPGVSDAKRAQIRKLLEEYHYESNPLAKALNYQKKKMSVAVVLPRVDAYEFLKKGMELVLQDFNSFNISVCFYETDSQDAGKQAEIIRKVVADKIAGIVILPIASDDVRAAFREAEAAGIPVVTLNTDLEESGRVCYIGQDMEKGGRVAAKMLSLKLPMGGKAGVISGKMNQATKLREKAFLRYIDSCSGSFSIEGCLDIQETEADAYAMAGQFFRDHPDLDALYITCGHVRDICRALKEVQKEGILKKKPEIVCHERYPEIIELIREDTVFVTVNGELVTQGRLAMRMLFEYLIYDQKPDSDVIYVGNEVLMKENV